MSDCLFEVKRNNLLWLMLSKASLVKKSNATVLSNVQQQFLWKKSHVIKLESTRTKDKRFRSSLPYLCIDDPSTAIKLPQNFHLHSWSWCKLRILILVRYFRELRNDILVSWQIGIGILTIGIMTNWYLDKLALSYWQIGIRILTNWHWSNLRFG